MQQTETLSLGGIDLVRIALLAALAILAHLVVRALKAVSERVLAPARSPGVGAREALARSRPKVATVTSLVVSAATFFIYFSALGLILDELGVPLTAYVASASVIGLAVGFGSQGLVQDVVIGLTLIFSDTFDIGDTIEVGGQIGRVEHVGLRFTRLTNFHGQTVFVPNRNINQVSRFRRGCIRAYVDVQIPPGAGEARVRELVEPIARGMRAQHRAILITDPEVLGVLEAEPGGWRYLRVKFRVWPGQGQLVETVFRQRALAALRELDPGYADWMVTVTYRVLEDRVAPHAP